MAPASNSRRSLALLVFVGPPEECAPPSDDGQRYTGLEHDGVVLNRFSTVEAVEYGEVLHVADWGLRVSTAAEPDSVDPPAGHRQLWTHQITVTQDEEAVSDWRLAAGVMDWGWSHPRGQVSVASGVSLVSAADESLVAWSARALAWAQVVSARVSEVEAQLTALEGDIGGIGSDGRLAPLWDDLHRLDRSVRDAGRRLELISSSLQGPRRAVFCMAVDEWRVREQLSALESLVEMLRSDLQGVERRRTARLERARTILISILTATAALSLAVDMLWFAHSEVVTPAEGPARLGGPPVMRLFDWISPQLVLVLVALLGALLVVVLVPRRER